MARAYGWNKDREDHGMPPVEHLARKMRVPVLPNKADLTASVLAGPGILDQLQIGGCVGNSGVGAIETRFAVLGTPIAHRSAMDMYDLARCIDRARSYPTGTLPKLEDVGSMPADAWTGVQKYGLVPWENRPTDNATANDEPTLGNREDGAEFLVAGAYRINATGSGMSLAVRTAIASGFPVQVCSDVDSAFENWQPGQAPIKPPKPTDILGGHALYVCAYELVGGVWVYKIVNSWSAGWGDNGFCQCSEAWMQQTSDCYVADVKEA